MLPLALLALLPVAYAYTWSFTSSPKQCETLSLSASGGSPPYTALIVPTGATPLANGIEARRVMSMDFNDSSTLSFQLRYPKGSQFVMVVSDKTGYGSGGASAVVAVLDGTDGCFSTSKSVSADWYIGLEPTNQLVQCTPGRIWWDNSLVQGTPYFVAAIPGGDTFTVPQSSLSDIVNFGRGFNWTPSIATGTQVLLIGGDNRFLGSGGSVTEIVNGGANNDASCLNSTSPSSTAGSPAGGSYPTNTSGAGTGGGSSSPSGSDPTGSSGSSGGHHTNIGAIVGGVVGGVAALLTLALLLLFFMRRRRFHKQQKERPVDLLQDGERDSHDGQRDNLPQYYQPEPFMLPDPAHSSHHEGEGLLGGAAAGAAVGGERQSVESSSRGPPSAWGYGVGGARPGTPDQGSTSQGTRKSAAGPGPLRPVNIIQHEDARRVDAPLKEDAAETIELPPAYTNIRRGASVRVPGEAEEGVPATGAAAAPHTEGALAEGSPVPSPPAPTTAAA